MWLRKDRGARASIGIAVFPEFVAVGTRVGATVQLRETLFSTPTLKTDEFATALRTLLSEMPGAAARIKCVVSNRLARFAVLPWSSALLKNASAQRYAQDHLSASFGDAAESLEVRMQPAPYGTPRFLCALPRALLDGLNDSIRESGASILSLKPLLTAAIDGAGKKMGVQTKLVGTVERCVLHYALTQNTHWVQVSSETLPNKDSNDLGIALRRIEVRNPWLDLRDPIVLADGVSEGRAARLLQLTMAD